MKLPCQSVSGVVRLMPIFESRLLFARTDVPKRAREMRADGSVVRAGHPSENLRHVVQVVDRPRGEQLAERDLAEGGMKATLVEIAHGYESARDRTTGPLPPPGFAPFV